MSFKDLDFLGGWRLFKRTQTHREMEILPQQKLENNDAPSRLLCFCRVETGVRQTVSENDSSDPTQSSVGMCCAVWILRRADVASERAETGLNPVYYVSVSPASRRDALNSTTDIKLTNQSVHENTNREQKDKCPSAANTSARYPAVCLFQPRYRSDEEHEVFLTNKPWKRDRTEIKKDLFNYTLCQTVIMI